MKSLDSYEYGFYDWMKQLHCPAVVDFFALYGPTPHFRSSALSCVTNDAVLKRIALEERENGSAIRAFRRIRRHDTETLLKLSRYTWNPRLRQMALNKLEHASDAETAPAVTREPPPQKENASFARYLDDCAAGKRRYDASAEKLRDCLLHAGADEQELLFGYAQGGPFAPKNYDGTEASAGGETRVFAVCNPNLSDPEFLKTLTLLGGAVGLAAYARGAGALNAEEILRLTEDDCVALAAVERASDPQTLRAFADCTEKPYAARMRAYGKLGDSENLRRYAERPERYHSSTWKCGYSMDSSNFAAIRACTDEETLNNLSGYGAPDLLWRWSVRVASPEEDRRSSNIPERGKVPEEDRARIPAGDLARCEAVCRSLDTREITNELRAMSPRRDLLFVCAVEGMAFCRGRAAHLLASRPDTQEELQFIAQNEENPYIAHRAANGIRYRNLSPSNDLDGKHD